MNRNEILESLLWLIKEEIDQALALSDKRRKEFKATVFSNPPAKNTLKEAPEPPGPGDTEPVDASPDLGEPQDLPAPAGGSSELGDIAGQAGTPTGAPGSTPMDPAMDGEDPMDDPMGGGGGGGDLGMGGFGGGGGGGGLESLSGEGEGEEGAPPPPPASYDPFKDADTLEDRLRVIMDTAESLSAETQDPQVVLKSIKGLIQNGFSNPEQASKVIADLFSTSNPVLQQVSRRLALFTYGI